MKRYLYILLIAVAFMDCNPQESEFRMKSQKGKVTWENSVIGFSTPMESEQGKEYNPAFQAFVKTDEGKRIIMAEDKTGLGYGASSPMGISGLYKPQNSLTKAEILSNTSEQLIIHLSYDYWEILGSEVKLDKQITLYKNSPIMAVIDYYEGGYELLNVAAGIALGKEDNIAEIEDGYSINYSNGMTGIIIMPDADGKQINSINGNAILKKGIEQEQILRYYIGLSNKGSDYLLERFDELK